MTLRQNLSTPVLAGAISFSGPYFRSVRARPPLAKDSRSAALLPRVRLRHLHSLGRVVSHPAWDGHGDGASVLDGAAEQCQ